MMIEGRLGRVEVRLTESFTRIRWGVVSMRHTRTFVGVCSRQLISILLGLKFCGEGGLMVGSSADSEEDSLDGTSRFIRNFRPLGASFGSSIVGSFHVRQEFLGCSPDPRGARGSFRISFFPATPKRSVPVGAFLWEIEPAGAEKALWRELINTEETRIRELPDLIVPRKWIILIGHNRLMDKAARRIAEVLSPGAKRKVVFAEYAEADRFNFWPDRHA